MDTAEVLSRVKQRLARWQTSPRLGKRLRTTFCDQIPVGRTGVVAHIAGAPVDDRTVAELFRGFYEEWETRFVRQYLPANLPVIECGTSLGIVTSLIAQKLEADVLLVTVEANGSLVPFAKRNVGINAPGKRVEFIHAALDPSHDGPTTQLSVGPSQYSHLGSGNGVVEVPRTCLSEIIRTYGLGHYSMVCDIEGAEDLILLHEPDALQGCQHLVIEVHPFELPVIEDYIRRFAAAGFRLIDRSGRNKRGQVLCFSH